MKLTFPILAALLTFSLAAPATAGERNDWFDDWRDHRFERKGENLAFRQERRDDWQGWVGGEYEDRAALFQDRSGDRQDWRSDRRSDRKGFWQDILSGHGDD
jgi:hypothetical protein